MTAFIHMSYGVISYEEFLYSSNGIFICLHNMPFINSFVPIGTSVYCNSYYFNIIKYLYFIINCFLVQFFSNLSLFFELVWYILTIKLIKTYC